MSFSLFRERERVPLFHPGSTPLGRVRILVYLRRLIYACFREHAKKRFPQPDKTHTVRVSLRCGRDMETRDPPTRPIMIRVLITSSHATWMFSSSTRGGSV